MSVESELDVALEGRLPGPLVISLDGAPVGALDLAPAYAPFWRAALGLSSSVVPWTIDIELQPSSRGKGIGRVAIRQASSLAFEMGATDMVVDVRADNTASIRCFEAAGYEKVRFEENHDEGDGEVGPFWFLRLERTKLGSRGWPTRRCNRPNASVTFRRYRGVTRGGGSAADRPYRYADVFRHRE